MFHITVLKGMFLYAFWTTICRKMSTLRCRKLSGWHRHVSYSGMAYEFVMCQYCLSNSHEIPFSKKYRYVTRHSLLYLTEFYISVCTINLLLLAIYLSLASANIPSNTKVTSIAMVLKIRSGPMDLLFTQNFICSHVPCFVFFFFFFVKVWISWNAWLSCILRKSIEIFTQNIFQGVSLIGHI